uniref:Sperm microtubule associated protein 2 n=1 Tax=Felis catus TaxID=9685 RepID=A0ABI8ARD5_FELCA
MECGPRECECGRAILLLPGDRDHRHAWVLGSKAAGLGRTQYMGDRRRSLSHGHHSSEAEGGPDWGQDDDALGVQGAVFGSPGTKDTTCLDDEELSFEDREAETLPEEVTEGEPPGPRAPEEALEPLERVLEKDAEGIPEMSRLSITQRLPSAASARGMRRRRKRVFELAKPKTNWQALRDRPSVYWTERFLEDTTLTVTVPVVTRRVEELARPKRFYSEYFNNNRCPKYPRQPRWQSPAQGSYSWQSPGPQPPCWKSGTPCQNPSRTCRTTIASFTWPCPRPSRTSVFLTEIHAGKCWTSPRRQWPVPGSSLWPSPKCAKTSTRAMTPTTFPPRLWWLRHPLACTSWPPPRASPKECERPRPGL